MDPARREKKKPKTTTFHWVSSLTHITTPGHTQKKNPTPAGTSKEVGQSQKDTAESSY